MKNSSYLDQARTAPADVVSVRLERAAKHLRICPDDQREQALKYLDATLDHLDAILGIDTKRDRA